MYYKNRGIGFSYNSTRTSGSSIGSIFTAIVNGMLRYGKHPDIWKLAKTIVLGKPGKKSYSIAGSFRPIALLPIFSRIFESVMTHRLVYIAESNNFFPAIQYGFRKFHSTTDGLKLLRDFIEANVKKKWIVSLVSLDLTGAYDNVNHSKLMEKLYALDIPSYIISWLSDFITNRSTYFSHKNMCSSTYYLHQGVPQGSPIAPILFLLFNADLLNELSTQIYVSAFADDIFLYTASANVADNIDLLQNCIDWAIQWSIDNHQKFSALKSALIHFGKESWFTVDKQYCNICIWDPESDYTFILTPVNQLKLLGVIFDSMLTWTPHVNSIIKRVNFKWNHIKRQCRKFAKLNYTTRRLLYKGLIEPLYTYGYEVWHGVTQSRFSPLDKQFYGICRFICGALRNTSRLLCYHEAGLLPLRYRLDEFMEMQINRQSIRVARLPYMIKIPPWNRPLSNFSFQSFPSDQDAIDSMQTEITSSPDLIGFSDGSVRDDTSAMGFCWQASSTYFEKSYRLPNHTSIFEAEFMALVKLIESSLLVPWKTGIIFTDSQSNISRLSKLQSTPSPFIEKLLNNLNDELVKTTRTLKIHWIPSHCGISGNDRADELAKAGLSLSLDSALLTLPNASHLNRMVKLDARRKFQAYWSERSPSAYFYQQYPNIIPDIHKLHVNLPFRHSQWLTWCHTNTLPLNGWKSKRFEAQTPSCSCGHYYEDMDHFIFDCPLWSNQRKQLLSTVHCTSIYFISLGRLLNTEVGRSALFQFIDSTRRFSSA